MSRVKLLLVSSCPGGRSDFVAGWLGLLPNFVDNNWGIDPITGQSYGHMQFTKPLDCGVPFEKIWPRQFELSGSAEFYLAGSGHGFNLNLVKDKIDSGLIKTLTMTFTDPSTDFKKITWEYIVKSYLSHQKVTFFRAVNENEFRADGVIKKPSNEITDEDRISAVLRRLEIATSDSNPVLQYCPPITNGTQVEYSRLFQPGGSQYLCQQLGIQADPAYHRYWNQMLPLADSPDVLTVWGRTWKRSDYFN